MKKTLFPALLLGALSALLLLSSCNNDFGIMQSIQEEEKQAKDSLFYKTTVGGMTRLGANYYVQMNGIWTRPAAGDSWSSVSGGGLPSSYSCAGIASDGSTLYAALLGDGVYSSTDGTSWTLVSGTDSLNVDGIWAAGATIFFQDHQPGLNADISVTSDDVYTLYTGAAASTTIPGQIGKPFRGAAAADGALWVISGTTVFTGASGAAMNNVAAGAPTTKTLSAIAANAGGDLYLGTQDGFVYRREADTDAWAAGVEILASTEVTALQEVTVPAIRLLVGFGGNDGTGYYEIDSSAGTLGTAVSGGASGALLSDSTVYSTTLSNKPVNAFFLDGTTLFACATSGGLAGSGLYKNLYGASWGDWISE